MAAAGDTALSDTLSLLDWRRRVAALYADVRRARDPRGAWEAWRRGRDALFARHAQAPLPAAAQVGFRGLPYYPYDPALRVLAEVEPVPRRGQLLPSSGPGPMAFEHVGTAVFVLAGRECLLGLHWLGAYGGGLFVPFRDATAGRETYGAGRYLLDTVKGADLGSEGDRLVLDFNFAYNPSCSYDDRWACPLAPPENRLDVAVRAGERTPP